MTLASLRVAVNDGVVGCSFEHDGESAVSAGDDGPRLADLGTLIEQARRGDDGSELPTRLASVLPETVQGRVRRWAGGKRDATLVIFLAEDAALHALPWEALRFGLGLPGVSVVRASADPLPSAAPPASFGDTRLLVLGSAVQRGRTAPGVARELRELPARFDGDPFRAEALLEPDESSLARALAQQPSIVHLALAEVDGARSDLTLGAFCRVLASARGRLSLVVINACATAAAARAVALATGAAAIGWSDQVGDEDAADFSLFFYARLKDGMTPFGALRAYAGRPGVTRAAAIPVIYTPSVPSEEERRPHRSEAVQGLGNYRGLIDPSAGRGELAARGDLAGAARVPARLEITPQAAINPALLSNGQPALERVAVDASGPIPNASLHISCDVGASVSSYRETRSLLGGVESFDTSEMHFPNLYELLAADAGRRRVTFAVSLHAEGRVLAEATRSTVWMARNEWVDRRDAWAFIPAFVKPGSAAVRRIAAHANDLLAKMGEGHLSGYQRSDVRPQIKAIYGVLQRHPFEIGYANPPGSPVFLPGARKMAGQRVRDPDEIEQSKLGTCHDLSLLLASCAELVGIYPLVILMSGHTFFGFWTDPAAHRDHWAPRPGARGARFGDDWLIHDPATLQTLLDARAVELVEATYLTNPGRSYDDARAEGSAKVRDLRTETFDVAVDVWASRRAVQPT